MTVSAHFVFLYGTLKRSLPLHDAMAGQQFVSDAVTQPDYRMYRVAHYPGLVETESGQGLPIVGELWRVDPSALLRLDEIEAVDEGLYERRSIRLLKPSCPADHTANNVEAWFYLLNVAGCEDCGTCFRG